MELNLSTCFVQVTDPDAALTFYRDALGLTVRNDVENGGFRWVTVGSSTQPGVAVVLTNYVNGSPDDADTIAELITKGAMNGVNFTTDDVDGMFAAVKATGAEVLQEPTDQFWGTRDCAFRDPAGNMVRIDQPPAG